jgi:hypothetical protein
MFIRCGFYRFKSTLFMKNQSLICAVVLIFGSPLRAGVLQYGDKDTLGFNTYNEDPVNGASLEGLAAGVVTYGAPAVTHGFPYSPDFDEFPGTDQIYVGSGQSGFHDGYSSAGVRLGGPQSLTLDYSPLVPVGQIVSSFTLGISADDFQFSTFGQPFIAYVNGVANDEVTNALNGLNDLTGPYTQFFSIGLDPALLLSSHVLTLEIDQGGDGGDGWGVDFLTVGVTTSAVPEPSGACLLALGSCVFMSRARRAGRHPAEQRDPLAANNSGALSRRQAVGGRGEDGVEY